MSDITGENPIRFWPGRRRWHLQVSFPSLEASPSVSPFSLSSWCWPLSPRESLDSAWDRHDGGFFDVVSLLGALCQETWFGGPMLCSIGVRRYPCSFFSGAMYGRRW